MLSSARRCFLIIQGSPFPAPKLPLLPLPVGKVRAQIWHGSMSGRMWEGPTGVLSRRGTPWPGPALPQAYRKSLGDGGLSTGNSLGEVEASASAAEQIHLCVAFQSLL